MWGAPVGGSPTHGGVDHPGAIHGHVAPGARPLDGDNAEPHRDQIEESCGGGRGVSTGHPHTETPPTAPPVSPSTPQYHPLSPYKASPLV